jgi:hypothetical protein
LYGAAVGAVILVHFLCLLFVLSKSQDRATWILVE